MNYTAPASMAVSRLVWDANLIAPVGRGITSDYIDVDGIQARTPGGVILVGSTMQGNGRSVAGEILARESSSLSAYGVPVGIVQVAHVKIERGGEYAVFVYNQQATNGAPIALSCNGSYLAETVGNLDAMSESTLGTQGFEIGDTVAVYETSSNVASQSLALRLYNADGFAL